MTAKRTLQKILNLVRKRKVGDRNEDNYILTYKHFRINRRFVSIWKNVKIG